MVAQSNIAATASSQVTTAMRPIEATLTPSNKPPVQEEQRSQGIQGLIAATKTNAGRKMPTVATRAPGGPASL